MSDRITLSLPSKGAIAEPTYSFLREAGLKIHKPNTRQYTGSIPALHHVDVLFQRVKDVAYKVADGTAQLGITGLDVVSEHPHEDLVVIHDALGYGHCQLVVAVPETWVDVETMADLRDVALDFRERKQRNLRIATTFANSARRYLHTQGIHHFNIVQAEGAIEVAPTIGYADIIVDLTQSGTTLRENHLKQLADGTILESQACLIGNKRLLRERADLRETVKTMLEYIDAALVGRRYSQVTVNIAGNSADEVAARVRENSVTGGLLGPSISPLLAHQTPGRSQKWFTVVITVENHDLLEAVQYLRSIGATHVVTIPVKYVFSDHTPSYERLATLLG